MITSTPPAALASAAAAPAVGCAIIQVGECPKASFGLIVSSFCAPERVTAEIGRTTLTLHTQGGPLTLRGLPEALLRQYQAGSGIIVAADTLAEVNALWTNGKALQRPTSENEVASAFNGFLNAAVRAGTVSIAKVSIGYRQPEIEAFVRKLAISLGGAGLDVKVTTRHLTPMPGMPSGPQAVSEAAYAVAFRTERFKAIAAAYRGDLFEPADSHITPSHSDFEAIRLVGYTSLTVGSPAKETAVNAMATIGAGLATAAGQDVKIIPEVLSGADSVFLQSYSDCYALLILAKFCERQALQELVRDIYSRRANSGDFTLHSTAPMSHDTQIALGVLEGFLATLSFEGVERHTRIVDQALAIAFESTDQWLQDRGVTPVEAAAIVHRASQTFRLID